MTKSHFLDIFHLDDRATLAKKPRDKMNALLEAPNTSEAVQALDPMEFYDLFHAVGPADAMALVEYAAPEQVQTCLDLDIWRDDQMRDEHLAPWVEQLLAVPDEKFAEFWRELDPEVMALYLSRNIRLYMAEDKNDEVDIPDQESQNIAQSPDFTYWIAYPEDADKAEQLRQLVEKIYAVLGIEKAWSTLEAMHFEIGSDLEEQAYRFRTERIREYGFMPRHEAAGIFANVDVLAETESIRKEVSAELYIQSYPATNKLDAALAALDQSIAADCYFAKILSKVSNIESIKIQLLSIAQQVAVFDGFQPHEVQGFEDSMLLAVSTINLGLEYASELDDALAERILSHVALKRLFRLGYSLTIELQRKAKILLSRGHLSIIDDQPMSLLTVAQRDALEGMMLERPRPSNTSLTPFMTMHDMHCAASVIADVATRELFFGGAVQKTRDDISLLAYTHDVIQGVENVNFDNVAITWLTRRKMHCAEPWDIFDVQDELPTRDVVIEAISADKIRAFFKSDLPNSTQAALHRFAAQLKAYVDEVWPESEKYPDPQLVSALLIAED